MKNQRSIVRLVCNWLLFATMPLWIWPFILYVSISERSTPEDFLAWLALLTAPITLPIVLTYELITEGGELRRCLIEGTEWLIG
jgi:hypothetical protein